MGKKQSFLFPYRIWLLPRPTLAFQAACGLKQQLWPSAVFALGHHVVFCHLLSQWKHQAKADWKQQSVFNESKVNMKSQGGDEMLEQRRSRLETWGGEVFILNWRRRGRGGSKHLTLRSNFLLVILMREQINIDALFHLLNSFAYPKTTNSLNK